MNKNQKNVLIVTAAVIFLMLVFPPFHRVLPGRSINMGYGFIIDSPEGRATVNVGMLLVQWVGVLLIGGIAWLIVKDK